MKRRKTDGRVVGIYSRLNSFRVRKSDSGKHKFTVILYFVLRAIVIAILLRAALSGNWETAAASALTLLLFFLPLFVEKTFRVKLPDALECIVLLFAFSAEILGEIGCFYIRYPYWDDMLHTVNGFIFAAFGFCLVDLFNRNERFSVKLSPLFLALTAFCFSMTIGVLWEFFEFSMDHLLLLDMQKDTLLSQISTVTLDPDMANRSVTVPAVAKTVLYGSGGEVLATVEGGYLDVGLLDTMHDLFVNFIGAVVFSVIGAVYVRRRGRGVIARQFIPEVKRGGEPSPGETEQ